MKKNPITQWCSDATQLIKFPPALLGLYFSGVLRSIAADERKKLDK